MDQIDLNRLLQVIQAGVYFVLAVVTTMAAARRRRPLLGWFAAVIWCWTISACISVYFWSHHDNPNWLMSVWLTVWLTIKCLVSGGAVISLRRLDPALNPKIEVTVAVKE